MNLKHVNFKKFDLESLVLSRPLGTLLGEFKQHSGGRGLVGRQPQFACTVQVEVHYQRPLAPLEVRSLQSSWPEGATDYLQWGWGLQDESLVLDIFGHFKQEKTCNQETYFDN